MCLRTCVYISSYHGKRGISLWVIRYIQQFELAVGLITIAHYHSRAVTSAVYPISHRGVSKTQNTKYGIRIRGRRNSGIRKMAAVMRHN